MLRYEIVNLLEKVVAKTKASLKKTNKQVLNKISSKLYNTDKIMKLIKILSIYFSQAIKLQ